MKKAFGEFSAALTTMIDFNLYSLKPILFFRDCRDLLTNWCNRSVIFATTALKSWSIGRFAGRIGVGLRLPAIKTTMKSVTASLPIGNGSETFSGGLSVR